jgi:hypothetical protein
VEAALAQVLWEKQSVAMPLLVSEFLITAHKVMRHVHHSQKMRQCKSQKSGIAQDVVIQQG